MISCHILAAGSGTRMFPYDELLPKPLMPLGGRPFIRYIVDYIGDSGTPVIGVLEQDLDLFKHEFRDEPHIRLMTIPRARGTAGILLDHVDPNSESFMVWYGDCLIEGPIFETLASSVGYRGCVGQLVVNKKLPTEYGILNTLNGRITSFGEHQSVPLPFWTGIGIFRTASILPYLGQDMDLGHDVFPRMIKDGLVLRTDIEADYFDIGTTAAYLRAKKAIKGGIDLPGVNPKRRTIEGLNPSTVNSVKGLGV